MKNRFLFPYWCKFLGLGLFLVHIPIILFKKSLDFHIHESAAGTPLFLDNHHLFFMVTTLTMLSGLVLIAFSKERIEDEQIVQLRMDTLQLAIYINYIILIVSLAFTDKNDYWDVIRLNLWLPLIFFILLFRWKMYRNNRLLIK